MARIQRFEELIAWQKGMDLAVEAYRMTRKRPVDRDFPFVDQVRRSAMSVPANVAEGFDRGSRAEFHRFLSIAKGSCAELATYVHLAHRLDYIDTSTFTGLLAEANEVGRIIGGLRSKVATQRPASKR
jgi:four helix bundle protein